MAVNMTSHQSEYGVSASSWPESLRRLEKFPDEVVIRLQSQVDTVKSHRNLETMVKTGKSYVGN